jgi:dipeptidyl aminopeptidase/acylaminoacyl peptidase
LPLGIDIVDVAGGGTRTLIEGTVACHCTEPRWSPRGDRILYLANFDTATELSYFGALRTVDVGSGATRDLTAEWGGCQTAEWLPDGERVAFVGAAKGDRAIPGTDLWVVGAGGPPDCRTPDDPAHVGSRAIQDMPIWDLVLSGGLVVESDDHAYVTVQSGGEAGIWKVSLSGPVERTRVAGGERTCLVLDSHPVAGRLFVSTDACRPTELCLVSATGERRLTRLNDEVLAGWPEMRIEHVEFAAPDGLDLEGWYLSRADSAGPSPTVLNIHQGPYTAVGHAFRFDLHLLASHGIGVMFSNFRGSAGYGQRFMDRIGGEWGEAGFPDHMATIDAAVERGLADPDRLGVWGASHGGFATSWVVGHTDRFAAAVAEAAVTDFAAAYYLSDIPDFFALEFGGRPDEVPEIYRERSSLTYASNCTTPILMLHCEGDVRCPLGQAEAFHRAVLDAGCVSEIAIIRGGDHLADAMGPPHTRLAQNEALLDWFTRYLTKAEP